ncbi:MAG TPA: TIGR03435 family protein [Acidobacteriaceae bacterium]|nr:TIGR03435 family protein [Acidobacteriaceae bacterium]
MAFGQAALKAHTDAAPVPGSAGLTFDVASVRPSLDFNSPAMQAAFRAGKMPKFGPHVEGLRAEYNQMQLRDLVANAYEVKTYQVVMLDGLNGQRFDIAARMPEGSTPDDAPKMLRALLADRFKLEAVAKTEDRPVLGLMVGKSGPKMKSVPAPAPLDEKAELKPGERRIDTPDGPAVMTMKPGNNGYGAMMNMGAKGTMTYSGRFDQQSMSMTMHVDFDGVTMSGLCAMLSQMMTQGPGGGSNSKPVVDMTGLAGNYAAAIEFTQQFNFGGGGQGGPGGAGASVPVATDPGGNGQSGIYDSVKKMGLKLESTKAPVEQVTVTHAEKMPTEN